jgi:hypothetical protein
MDTNKSSVDSPWKVCYISHAREVILNLERRKRIAVPYSTKKEMTSFAP